MSFANRQALAGISASRDLALLTQPTSSLDTTSYLSNQQFLQHMLSLFSSWLDGFLPTSDFSNIGYATADHQNSEAVSEDYTAHLP